MECEWGSLLITKQISPIVLHEVLLRGEESDVGFWNIIGFHSYFSCDSTYILYVPLNGSFSMYCHLGT